MTEHKNFFEALNKLAGSAFGTAVHAKDELVSFISHQMESLLKRYDFISRDEFETMREKMNKMQKEIDSLKGKKKSKESK